MSSNKKRLKRKFDIKKRIKEFNYWTLPIHIIFIAVSCFGLWYIPLIYYLLVGVYVLLRKMKAKQLYNIMSKNSVLIAGQKGAGKDLLTQGFVTYSKPNYYSNMNYGGSYHSFKFDDVSLAPNTYENFINGKIEKINDYEIEENSHIIVSDTGITLPAQYDTLLSKKYPSLPIYFALSRHLSNTPILINTQAYGRVWIKLREQFDNYILCKHTTSKGIQKILKLFPILYKYIYIECYYYEQLEAFEKKLQPFSATGIASKNNALYSTTADTLKKTYDFENGRIIKYIIPIKIKDIKYDTRQFAKYLLTQENILKYKRG